MGTRRSIRALAAGGVLALLLTVAGSGPALGAVTAAEAGAAGVTARTDVYMRDTVTDIGIEPHSLNPLWQSPDIRVCHTPVYCAASQNPIVGMTNYIFVTLHNPGPYGSGDGTGTLTVYRTTPGGGAAWPAAWTAIGSLTLSVPAGTTTVMLPWTGVPGPGHFCLIARWVSQTDPMTGEGPDIGPNTRNNNNIVWRNVDSVNPQPGDGVNDRPFAIGNTLRTTTANDVLFTPFGRAFQDIGGRIVVDLGPALFERWRAGGGQGKGIRLVGQTQVQIVDPAGASINGILLAPGERLTFRISFVGGGEKGERAGLDVTQFGPDTTGARRADLGGVRYEIAPAADKQ
nr:hypothetical protein [Micromonospora sp. DSM 115978]